MSAKIEKIAQRTKALPSPPLRDQPLRRTALSPLPPYLLLRPTPLLRSEPLHGRIKKVSQKLMKITKNATLQAIDERVDAVAYNLWGVNLGALRPASAAAAAAAGRHGSLSESPSRAAAPGAAPVLQRTANAAQAPPPRAPGAH
jgi:hypothetical protein